MTVPSLVLPTRGSKSGRFHGNEFRAGILIYSLSLTPSYSWHQGMVGPWQSPISSLQPPAHPLPVPQMHAGKAHVL